MFDPHRENSVFYCSVNELALVVFPNNLGVAEREGFEPSVRGKPVQRISNPSPSATRPPLHELRCNRGPGTCQTASTGGFLRLWPLRVLTKVQIFCPGPFNDQTPNGPSRLPLPARIGWVGADNKRRHSRCVRTRIRTPASLTTRTVQCHGSFFCAPRGGDVSARVCCTESNPTAPNTQLMN